MITGHQWNLGLRFRRTEQRVAVHRGRVFFKIWFMGYGDYRHIYDERIYT